ncbi:hypothetical protein KY347_02165 [Candidatus Woesearchaeota archaeon]|nr:hypothetical protein [Candidatus Woesearchaeota archaeon]
MINHKHHKVFLTLVVSVSLVIGLFLGDFLAANLLVVDLEAVKLALILISIILLLAAISLLLEVMDILKFKTKRGKKK